MISDAPPVPDRHRMPLVGWFLIAGFVELAVALIAAYLVHAPLPILFVLLPTLNLWGDVPETPQGFDAVVAGLFLFGGTFLVYGTAGVVAGLIVQAWGSQRPRD
jgi:hypothetical protein